MYFSFFHILGYRKYQLLLQATFQVLMTTKMKHYLDTEMLIVYLDMMDQALCKFKCHLKDPFPKDAPRIFIRVALPC